MSGVSSRETVWILLSPAGGSMMIVLITLFSSSRSVIVLFASSRSTKVMDSAMMEQLPKSNKNFPPKALSSGSEELLSSLIIRMLNSVSVKRSVSSIPVSG